MNALIFAAGLGTRLKPLTDTMPKAMVPVNGKPLLQILIEKLKAVGVKNVVINVHHFAQQIIDFVNDNDSFGIDIRFSDETDMLLETGGGLKKASQYFDDKLPVLVHNVDILSNADLLSLYGEAEHTTLLVSERQTQRYLLFDDGNRLVGWTNIATGEVKSPYKDLDVDKCHKYAYSGIQVFNQELLPYMDSWEGKFSIIDFYLSVCDKVEIRCKVDRNLQLLDVGKLDTIAKAEEFLKK
ncbi:MAG: NTP transferase domain-containing protein [Bacteroidaceae bacterium]|nr:NTP transferase domain-containing protein [Bacteroidaceae bacterium]